MIPLSRRQLVEIVAVVVLIAVSGRYLLLPLGGSIARSFGSVYLHFQGTRQGLLAGLERENKALQAAGGAALVTDPKLSSSMFYDFVRTSFAQRAIEQSRCEGSNGDRLKVTCAGDFHTIAGCINDIENGPYVCSVEELHLLSTSLLDSRLQIQLTLAQHRGE